MYWTGSDWLVDIYATIYPIRASIEDAVIFHNFVQHRLLQMLIHLQLSRFNQK